VNGDQSLTYQSRRGSKLENGNGQEETKDEKPLVPDTSAILTGSVNLLGENIVVPSMVLWEIAKGKPARIIKDQEEMLKVVEPQKSSITKIREQAGITGDLKYLSETDIEVLAVAFEIKGKVITNDYSMQNVAKTMGIAFESCGIEPIKNEIQWSFRCKGCRKIYEENIKECRICGHKVVRFRKVE
jgi:UPF0271 protein